MEEKRCERSAESERENLVKAYSETRGLSEKICETLEPEDCVVQTMPEASPTKWHLAHTSWFFETFVLRTAFQDYQTVSPSYSFLFNSYYNAVGKMHARPKRGLISRPTLSETKLYRRRVDEAMDSLFQNAPLTAKFGKVIELGINHEQQHQELMVTDIKNVFFENPLRPVFRNGVAPSSSGECWYGCIRFPVGAYQVGFSGEAFRFDNEEPSHRVFTEAFELASRLVTNWEYQTFIDDGGYDARNFGFRLGGLWSRNRACKGLSTGNTAITDPCHSFLFLALERLSLTSQLFI